jgi:hypothetical protein
MRLGAVLAAVLATLSLAAGRANRSQLHDVGTVRSGVAASYDGTTFTLPPRNASRR